MSQVALGCVPHSELIVQGRPMFVVPRQSGAFQHVWSWQSVRPSRSSSTPSVQSSSQPATHVSVTTPALQVATPAPWQLRLPQSVFCVPKSSSIAPSRSSSTPSQVRSSAAHTGGKQLPSALQRLPAAQSELLEHTGTHAFSVSTAKQAWPASQVPSWLQGTKQVPPMQSVPLGHEPTVSSQKAEQKPPATPLLCSSKQWAFGMPWHSTSVSHESPTLPSHSAAATQSLSAQSTAVSLSSSTALPQLSSQLATGEQLSSTLAAEQNVVPAATHAPAPQVVGVET